MMTSVMRATPERREHGRLDALLVGQRGGLELLRVRQRHLGHADALDRRVEVVEADALDAGGELGADAVGRPALLDAHARGRSCDTDAATVSTSSGRSERRSTTSALMPWRSLQALGDVQRADGRVGVRDQRHVACPRGRRRRARSG